ncbi:hypothetical protein Tco_1019883 [Tanacetum coccineum]|uniref:Gag-pol polyprotein n=1 Tax=Tanacetum coccineum TaxID=301880 RepID=A0ABQ5FZQ7_9ASTR
METEMELMEPDFELIAWKRVEMGTFSFVRTTLEAKKNWWLRLGARLYDSWKLQGDVEELWDELAKLGLASRPDIVFATFVCACYQARPTVKHLKEVKQIFWYMQQSYNMGLWYPKDSGFELIAYSDANHVGCHDDCKSTSGGLQFLGEKLVNWSSKKQDCTAMSTAEAEYVSLSACCAQVIWIRTQLLDYGYKLNKILMYCDSKSTIAISCNPVQHSRTKHIDIRYHFIKEHVEKGMVESYFVGTEYQLADLFTKALSKERFQYLVYRIGKRCMIPTQLESLIQYSSFYISTMDLHVSILHTLKEDGSKYRFKLVLDTKDITMTVADFRRIFQLPQARDNNHAGFVDAPTDNFVSNQGAPNFVQYFKLNELKAQSQEKDTVIRKLKERIKSLGGNMNEDKIKKDIEEIETINIELDHRVHTQEQATILMEVVEQGKFQNPLNNSLDSALKSSTSASGSQPSGNTKKYKIQQTPSSTQKNKCNGCMLSDNHDLCVLNFINDVNACVKSKFVKKSSKREVWKPTSKVFTKIRYNWRPTGQTFTIVENAYPLTRIITTTEVPLGKPTTLKYYTPKPVVTLVYSRKPKKSKTNVPVSKPKIIKSISANNKEPSKSWGSKVSDVPSSSLDKCM